MDRGTHLGQRSRAAQTGRTHDRYRTRSDFFSKKPCIEWAVHTRHLASWLGLTPRDHSTGGKQRLGGISRAGNERLRQLLVLGATAVIRHAKPGRASAWLLALLERRPRKLAAVALANKMARIVWAMMTSGEAYRQPKPVAG